MFKTSRVRKVLVRASAALGSGLLIAAAAAGCEQPPDTSPSVTITSPTQDQTLPAGQPIEVRFSIGGYDATGPTMTKFVLGVGSAKEYGKGKVRAFIGNSNYLAETANLPTDANPFVVPNAAMTSTTAAQIVTPGRKDIRLILYYNDEFNTPVNPQRQGVVTVNIQ